MELKYMRDQIAKLIKSDDTAVVRIFHKHVASYVVTEKGRAYVPQWGSKRAQAWHLIKNKAEQPGALERAKEYLDQWGYERQEPTPRSFLRWMIKDGLIEVR
jgi:hypothetical protein